MQEWRQLDDHALTDIFVSNESRDGRHSDWLDMRFDSMLRGFYGSDRGFVAVAGGAGIAVPRILLRNADASGDLSNGLAAVVLA